MWKISLARQANWFLQIYLPKGFLQVDTLLWFWIFRFQYSKCQSCVRDSQIPPPPDQPENTEPKRSQRCKAKRSTDINIKLEIRSPTFAPPHFFSKSTVFYQSLWITKFVHNLCALGVCLFIYIHVCTYIYSYTCTGTHI